MPTPSFSIRQVYNFDVYPSSVIGSNFKGVTVLAIMDSETANKEFDTQSAHIQIYPFVPGMVNDPKGYDYIRIRTISGETTIIGIPWIKEETIQLVESRTITVKLGNVSASDVPKIRDVLSQNGFSSFDITIA
jgi:hypothetical protein